MTALNTIIVMGASAGGVEALKQLVALLPADLPAAILVAMHFPANGVSILPKILSRYSDLPAVHPQQGDPIEPGCIYVSPPDYHLLIHTDPSSEHKKTISLGLGPRENGFRPAIDCLFRSAAQVHGLQIIGVILSGTMDDGVLGLMKIKTQGGFALVQDPEEALFDGMPRNAIENVPVDQVLKVAELAARLVELAQAGDKKELLMLDSPLNEETKVAQEKRAAEKGERPDSASPFTCPDCGGVLWEINQNGLLRFRCHVGHAYSPSSLIVEQADELERALWAAVRTLREKAALSRRMAAQAQQQQRLISAEQFLRRSTEADQQASLVEQMVLKQMDSKPTSEAGFGLENG